MPISFGVDVEELDFAIAPSTRSLTVSSGTKWDVSSKPEWISIQSITRSGVSPYEWNVSFSASENIEYDRDGVIIIKAVSDAAEISVNQDGRKGKYVAVESVSISPTELTMIEGENASLSVLVYPSNASVRDVTWKSSNTSVATISQSGLVEAIAEGTTLITVTTEDGNKTASCAVTVKPKIISVTGVSLNKTSLTMTEGDVQELTATVTPSNATDKSVSWSSSNTSVATVSSVGVVTAKSAGSATITVTTNDGGKKATCSVTVKAKTIAVTGVELDKTSISMTVGDTQSLTATVTPTNATNKSVTWSSSNTSVATVSSSGVVTAKSAGSATITVTTNDGGKKATCTVTVKDQKVSVTGVSLNITSLTMTEGDTQTLTATVTPSNATDKSVTWSSSNTTVATVSSSGVVTAKTAGSATITVTTNDGGKKATCAITVKAKTISVTGVSLNKTSLSMTVGDTQTLTATVTPSNATDKSVKWSSSNTSVATVSSSGVVTAKVAGTAKITVTTNDGGKTAVCSVTVNAQTVSVTSVSLNSGVLSMDVGTTSTLVATVLPSNATDKSVSWTSSNTTVATVSSSGIVSAKAAGTATITVTTNDGGKKATCFVSVNDPIELGAVSIKSITFSRAVVSCPISYGHNMVLEKGVCVSTKPSLTPFDNDGVFLAATDDDMLNLVIDGLSQGTTYYVIAFVTVSSDYGWTGSTLTAYTKPVSFTTLTTPSYVVPGLFSVSSAKKVYIASGNLMYKESEDKYHIFEHQYDYLGVKAGGTGDFDLSTWKNYVGFSFVVEQTNGTWRLMSSQESTYLFSERPNASKLKVTIVINNVTGMMLLPDDWICPSSISMPKDNETVSLGTWAVLQNAGAVFLPSEMYCTSSMYSNTDSYVKIEIPSCKYIVSNNGFGLARLVLDY